MDTLLLAQDALNGRRIGISVSDSPDLKRLGLLDVHVRLALGEIARCVLVMGGGLAYGGHILPDGFTVFLMRELEKYAQLEVNGSLHVYLAWQEHRERSLAELQAADAKLGVHGKLVCLDLQGAETDMRADRGEAAEKVADLELRKAGLTGMRKYMTDHVQGRVLLGGKRHGFQGAQPGLLEEARMALEAGQPLYLAGGFGGVTLDIAALIDPQCRDVCPKWESDPELDPREVEGLAAFATLVQGRGWAALKNGLSDEQNRRLAATHRPGEIAALVCQGLGRVRPV